MKDRVQHIHYSHSVHNHSKKVTAPHTQRIRGFVTMRYTNLLVTLPVPLPSIGPSADLGVQAVSLQVTISHPPGSRLPILSARPAGYLPSHRASPLLGRYQVILLGDRGTSVWTTCKVVTSVVTVAVFFWHATAVAVPVANIRPCQG